MDLQQCLANRANYVRLKLSSKVRTFDSEDAAIVVESKEGVKGDVILATDGLCSASPQPTGDFAYRILLQTNEIMDPDLRNRVTETGINIWIGPSMHIVGYSLLAGSMYDMVLLVPDDLPDKVAK